MKSTGLRMHKIFIEELKVDFSKVKVIVDLGAWTGKSPWWFSGTAPQAKVIAVEPMIENYILMIERIILRNLKNVIPILAAISYKTGSSFINIASKSESHSLLFKRKRMTGRRRLVTTTTWDDLMELLNIEEVDLAKVNIEGAEILFLKGMTTVFPQKMVIEQHQRLLSDKTFYNRLVTLIEEKGYKIIYTGTADLYLEKI